MNKAATWSGAYKMSTPAALAPVESRFRLIDGCELFVRDFMLEGDTTPCIVVMHGLGEHCGRYLHVAQFLNSCGFSVRTYDHRGHGQSGGVRGDVPTTLAIVQDAEVLIQDFAQRCRTRPILLGHSMGGLFAAHIATQAKIPLRGLILSSPALGLWLTGLDKFLLGLMLKIAPHFGVGNGLKTRFLSHDTNVVKAYEQDPLVHNKITAALLNSMLQAIEYSQIHAAILTIPTLLVVAADDHLVDPQGSRDFLAALPNQVSTSHFYAGFYHELFNEVGAQHVFNDVQQWLAARHPIA